MKSLTCGPRLWLAGALLVVLGTRVAFAQDQGGNPAKPVAPAKRAAIYNKLADAKVQVEQATAAATLEYKRVLLMFGGDWCGWCHRLHGLFASNAEIGNMLRNEYVLVMIDLESPNASSLLDQCKAALGKDELQKGVGYPFLAVLGADGKVVTAQRTDALEEGDHHDPTRVLAFLTKWVNPPKDAKVVLEEAVSRAASEDKRLFLRFGAPWCGWCHQLDEWLAQPEVAAVLGHDFVLTKIDVDRMTNGPDVMKRYRAADSQGIPWFAFLDSKGKALATSDGPGGNIGYPFEPKEIDFFLATVQAQGRRLEGGQIEELRKSLNETAERIKSKSKR